jgi:hypothetical protein
MVPQVDGGAVPIVLAAADEAKHVDAIGDFLRIACTE